MSYSYQRGVADRKMPKGYEANQVSSQDYAERNQNQPEIQQKHIELAEVINVVRSADDPDYTVNEDIGKAKVRRVVSEFDRPEESIGYAKPIDARTKSYPLEHELVVVVDLNNQPFYFQTANWRQNPNQNAAPFFSVSKIKGDSQTQQDYQSASAGVSRQSSGNEDINVEGDAYEVRTDVKPLRHRPGDTTVEGRVGQSIRLGRDSDMNPLIQLRVGQRNDVENSDFLKPFFEDINEDPTSLYLTSPDVEFPLEPSENSDAFQPTTIDFEDHLNSAEASPEQYDGAQILAASNRIALNAKEKQLLGFSSGEMSWVSLENFTVDAKQKIKTLSLEGNLHVSESDFDILTEGNIHLATESENEPIARGQQTVDRLVNLIEALLEEIHPTPVGPSGPPLPQTAQKYQSVLQKAKQRIRSEKAYVDEPQEQFERPA